METRFLVIKDNVCLIVVKRWRFNVSLYDDVIKKAPELFNDFCSTNNLDKNKFHWEITK